jgi:hypothetical protein
LLVVVELPPELGGHQTYYHDVKRLSKIYSK